MDMKRGGYPLRIFLKIIHKLDNTIDPKTKVTMIEAFFFKVSPLWKRCRGFSLILRRKKSIACGYLTLLILQRSIRKYNKN